MHRKKGTIRWFLFRLSKTNNFSVRNFRLQLKSAFDVFFFFSFSNTIVLLFQHIYHSFHSHSQNRCVFVSFVFGEICFFFLLISLILLSFFSLSRSRSVWLIFAVVFNICQIQIINKLHEIFAILFIETINSLVFLELFRFVFFVGFSFYFDNVIYCAYIECAKN